MNTVINAGRMLFISLCGFLLPVAAAFGQAPTPKPTPDKDEVISVKTDLIQTNVTVFDKDGRFVEGLKPEQFELKVDGKPTKIDFFEGRSAFKNVERTQAKENSTTAANPVAARNGRKVVFFVDDLHLSLDSLGRTRNTIRHFIEKDMLPTDNVLLVSASGQLGFLQQFIDNPAVLRAAVDQLRIIPNTSKDNEQPPMPEYIAIRILGGDRDAAEYYIIKILEGFTTKSAPMNKNAAREMVKQRANNIVAGMAAVTDTTLSTLESLMQNLSRINGQKIVFLISDGFYLNSKNSNFAGNTQFQRVVNQATRSGSVVYTIDARGLFSLMADATGAERPVDSSGLLKTKAGEDNAAQEGLFVLADETGGRFLKNQNYFDKWIERVLDENASYYLLAWSPEREETGNKFKRVEVSVVGRADLSVRLQRGYLVNWEKSSEKTAGNKNSNKTATETVLPNPSDDSTPKKILPTSLSLNYLDVPNVGGVLTSSVQIATDSLNYGEGGKQTAAVDVVGIVYDGRGKQVADFKTGLSIGSQTIASNEQSVIYNHRTPLAAGIYLVKVAAREAKSGRGGITAKWVEIPDLTKRQLTLGSLLLGAQNVKSSDATQQQVQFSVDHRFARPFNLSFMSFIYNAARAGGEPNLTTQIEVLDGSGRAVINSPSRPLLIKATTNDLARIPLTGAIRQDLLTPGTYLLRVTVNDLTAKSTAVQQTVFTVE
jgi:VWFA-related protein